MKFSILRLLIVMAMLAVWAATSRVVFEYLPSQDGAEDYIFATFCGLVFPLAGVAVLGLLYGLSGIIEDAIRRR